MRVVLVRSRLIIHHAKSYSSPIDSIIYYFLIHSIVSINTGLYPISSVPYTYKIKITVLSSFNLYKIQVSVLHCFNHALRFIVLMYFFNQKCAACKNWKLTSTETCVLCGTYRIYRPVCYRTHILLVIVKV